MTTMTTTKIYNQARQDWTFWSTQFIYQMGPVLPLNSPFHVLFIYHFTCRGNPTLLKSGLGRPWVQIFCLCHLWRHRSFGASYHQVDMVQDNIWDISEIKNHNTMHCSLTGAWRPVRLRYPVAGGVNPQVSSQSSRTSSSSAWTLSLMQYLWEPFWM